MCRNVISICSVALLFACGGTEKPADSPQGATPADEGTANETVDAGPTTTTTVLVGDGGELKGTKLSSSATFTVDGGTVGGQNLDQKQHDPGRRPEDIMTIIKSHRDEARACYDVALKTHPSIEGNIYITWTIDPKGAVSATGVDDSASDIHDTSLVKCIGDVIRKIPWASSPRGVETRERYPFNFHPHGKP